MSDQPTLLRQWTVLRVLSARRQGATLRELADDAKVTTKTIQRDLELLRRLGFPLVHTTSDRGRRHWKLDSDKGLLQLQFTVEEAAALYLGRQFLGPLAGTYFFDGAQQAFAICTSADHDDIRKWKFDRMQVMVGTFQRPADSDHSRYLAYSTIERTPGSDHSRPGSSFTPELNAAAILQPRNKQVCSGRHQRKPYNFNAAASAETRRTLCL